MNDAPVLGRQLASGVTEDDGTTYTDVCIGSFNSEWQLHGFATYESDYGDSYVGECQNDLQHGMVTFIWDDGTVY